MDSDTVEGNLSTFAAASDSAAQTAARNLRVRRHHQASQGRYGGYVTESSCSDHVTESSCSDHCWQRHPLCGCKPQQVATLNNLIHRGKVVYFFPAAHLCSMHTPALKQYLMVTRSCGVALASEEHMCSHCGTLSSTEHW